MTDIDTVTLTPSQIRELATTAAMVVLAPAGQTVDRGTAEEAVDAALDVLTTAIEEAIARRAELTAAALNVRDDRDRLRRALTTVHDAARAAYPSDTDALRSIREHTAAVLSFTGPHLPDDRDLMLRDQVAGLQTQLREVGRIARSASVSDLSVDVAQRVLNTIAERVTEVVGPESPR